jgi:acetylxylan esterase
MMRPRAFLAGGLLALALGLAMTRPADAASLQAVSNWGASGVPSYISMYVYVPDKPAASPPILVVSHFCGGSASAVFGQAQSGGIVAAADQYGFMMIFPQTTNAASSAKCWDVGSKQSLTHDGGGDTQAVAQMVKYAVTKYNANPNRVYATGDSSGGMMTQALLAVYPDVFKGGSSFAGVPAGCWSAGWSAASNWGGTCAGGNDIQTAQQWGDLARGMYPGYTGHRPRVQLVHGDADSIISYKNFGEAIKEWTNVLGLPMTPTSTTTGLSLGTHQATRQQWKNACGQVVLDALTSIGGDHGPSDALFKSTYVVPFLGLDKMDAVDPEVAACAPDGGVGGSGGTAGADGGAGHGGGGGRAGGGGTGGSGGVTGAAGAVGTGGHAGNGGKTGSAGTPGIAGSTDAGDGTGGSATGEAGAPGSGGTVAAGRGGSGAGGATATGAAGATGSGAAGTDAGTGTDAGSDDGSTGCSCALGGPESANHGYRDAAIALALALLAFARRRSTGSHKLRR